ncbi:cytochrome b/b6 domain-containing protein [Terasakiella sp. SH-1]|uniref:cytochrome b/b6 domain-containing protein n=1 Tax=Terasakiella sp. SH-1 TaxID=2560057 RepID=UPI001072F24A|nr:cytochrome b/b6 domain-containing protein [Terasakiella sp. SH-1]
MSAPEHQTATHTSLIWDLPLRLFHWAMVACVLVAAISGYFFEEWWLDLHVVAGYGLACLLVFRLIWGLVGSTYSRFSHFPLSRGKLIEHIKQLLTFKSPTYDGHNPLGAWMIVLMLATMVFLVLSGFLVWGGQENHGPLASVISYEIGDWAEDFHEVFANLLMVCVALHLCGVVGETILFKHPLIKAMITGKKPAPSATPNATYWHSIFGLLLLSIIIAAFTYWVDETDVRAEVSPLNQTYRSECGDCHAIYHPSLRSAANWQVMLDQLEDHYGEDASLDAKTLKKITQYLNEQNAHTIETEAAHKMGRHDTPTARITDTPYWQKKHARLSKHSFKHPKVMFKSNCTACHTDARSGRFDDVNIKLPKGIS